MSINAIHEELMANLESAVDVGKIMQVFGTLVGVIRDQQDKIDQLSIKSDKLEKVAAQALEAANKKPQLAPAPAPAAAPAPAPAPVVHVAAPAFTGAEAQSLAYLDDKISALEAKLNSTLLELHGLGEDSSILFTEEGVPEFLSRPGSFKVGPPQPAVPLSLVGISKKFVAVDPAIEEQELEDSNSVGFDEPDSYPNNKVESKPDSAVSSAYASKRSSLRDGTTADDQFNPIDEDASVEGTAEEAEAPTVQSSAEEQNGQERNDSEETALSTEETQATVTEEATSTTEAEEPELAAKEAPPLSGRRPPAEPVVAAAPPVVVTAPVVQKVIAPEPAPQVRKQPSPPAAAQAPSPERVISPVPAVSAVPARAAHVTKGLLRVTPVAERPSTMRESFSTRLAEIENSAFPGAVAVAPKSAALSKALWTANVTASTEENSADLFPNLHRRLIPHFQKYHIDAKLPHDRLVALAEYREIRSRDHKDKMDVNNLTILTPKKRQKLVRLLKQKGRFIQISRNMLEESRQKYAARSLKQNVEYVEAETRRLFNKVAQLRDSLKKQHVQLRYLLPLDFHETFDRLVDFLENLETKGGVEEIMALPKADKILCYDEHGNLPKAFIDAITARMRPVMLQELSGLKNQVQTLKEESLTHAQLAEIMQGEAGPGHVARTNSGGAQAIVADHSKEKEQARKKMISLIKDCIAEEKKAAEAELINRATVGSLLTATASTAPSPANGSPVRTSRPSKPQSVVIVQEAENAANKEYVDEQLAELKAQLAALQLGLDTSKDTHTESMSVMDLKVEALEQANRLMIERDAEAREARRKDAEAMKIMQKRLANVSIDNVMDELKVLQLQVNDRPSTTDVSNMMEGISLTFKKHLGENVVGLRGLVDQVYRQIHHKVNREDIKKLISAKLAQMEQDILRREEEMFSAASSTRCMSCGQLPADPTNAFVNHTAARRGGSGHPSSAHARDTGITSARGQAGAANQRNIQIPHGTAGFLKGGASTGRPNTSPNAETGAQFNSQFSIQNPSLTSGDGNVIDPSAVNVPDGVPRGLGGDPMDDELSLHSEHSHSNLHQNSSQSLYPNPVQVLGPVRSEEIYAVITGSAGLKSLMPQHTPMMPVRDPYGITTGQQPGGQQAQQSKRRQEKVPEPMYRKAKLAAHLKEMVKVSAPSAQNYGYSVNNPFFVVEGYTDETDPHMHNSSLDGGSSLYSRQGAKGRPRTQGNNVSAGNSATSVYVPIPRNSAQPNSVTQQLLLSASTSALGNSDHTGVGTVLPYITNKVPQQESDLVLKANTSKLNSYV